MWYIVKPLLRRPLMPLLIVLQIAVACAICCNALFLLQQKMAPILAPTGIADPSRLVLLHGIVARGTPWSAARMRAVEAGLRTVPGVGDVTYAVSFPMLTTLNMYGEVRGIDARTEEKVNAFVYVGDQMPRTLGLKFVAGRGFTPEEDVTLTGMGFKQGGPVVITRALADRLFPSGQALGRQIGYTNQSGGLRTVVGVVVHLLRSRLTQNTGELDYSMLIPGIPEHWAMPAFGVRLTTSNVRSACKSLQAVIEHNLDARMLPGQNVQCDTVASLRNALLAQPRAAVWLLAGVTLIVLIVTLIGVMGLTSYWVQQRTKAIGIRRALGAKRSDILRYIQSENLIVVAAGTILGLIAALGVNLWLMRHYELLRLPWEYLPLGGVLLLVLGQLAAAIPAMRASNIQPIVATRTI